MPDLDLGTVTSGSTEPGEPPDIGDGGGSGSGGGGAGGGGGSGSASGGTIIITGGSPPSSYQYDIVTLYEATGHAYLSFISSNMNCHSSVGVLNRNNTYGAVQSSSSILANCVAYASQHGFKATQTSSMIIANSVASICAINYSTTLTSSMSARLSASVFPIYYGVHTSYNSAWYSQEFETMTTSWASTSPVVAHYMSAHNSYSDNNSSALTTKTSAGLSGPILNAKAISFVWSQINSRSPFTISSGSTIADNPSASYNYVPFSHSVDYSNVIGSLGSVENSGQAFSGSGLLAIIGKGRSNYASVKGPTFMFQPENGSGKSFGGLTGAYSVSTLITPT